MPPKAIRTLLPALALAPWLGLVGFSHSDNPSNWKAAQWSRWRDREIGKILKPGFEYGGEKMLRQDDVISRSAESYRFLAPFLKNPEFLKNPARAQALGNFARFVTAQHWMDLRDGADHQTNALGMDVPDEEYWTDASRFLTFPELLKSQWLLKRMSNQATYKEAVDAIEAHNASLTPENRWIVFPFQAQFIRSVDRTTFGRLLVLVPNEKLPDGRLMDRWILFAIATPDMRPTEIMSVSMISVVREANSPTSRIYFSDFLRQVNPSTGDIELNSNALMKPNPSKNCYDCHKSGVLPIFPKMAYKFDAAGNLVDDPERLATVPDRINRLILKYGKSDLGHLDTDAYGPSLGGNTSRSDAFIANATKDRPFAATSYAKIKANMNCASCHDGFAKINYLLAVRSDRDVKTFVGQSKGLVQSYVEMGFMPPNNTLTPSERHALWECVMKEYFDPERGEGAFVDWLKGAGPRREGP
ncbi:hypothetical protein [Fimbriimonas ginsengisoli]|uniref:Uncharacterized protein n=1 Tax=Fimbriimonas ginsengisoli Gsoil 348 TaxID=661478 RepID=A0A068NPI4_FIMGI|nr:hypothetical protein [Fimbriimonas ginsengisoli]AIE85287.1 hypothetical protein OP10G_1919 [Fimbriimonas ginsengisoli Gsoil 348]